MNIDRRELGMNLEKQHLNFILPIKMVSVGMGRLLATDSPPPFIMSYLSRELLSTQQYTAFFVGSACDF